MPRASVALALILGAGLGISWGAVSLLLWSLTASTPAIISLPLALTTVIAQRYPADALSLGVAVSATLGTAAASTLLLFARLRGA